MMVSCKIISSTFRVFCSILTSSKVGLFIHNCLFYCPFIIAKKLITCMSSIVSIKAKNNIFLFRIGYRKVASSNTSCLKVTLNDHCVCKKCKPRQSARLPGCTYFKHLLFLTPNEKVNLTMSSANYIS